MLRITTAGESHGRALVAVIEGIPAGLFISADYINEQLARRQEGHGRGGRMKIEKDQVQIIAGVRGEETMGSPIALEIPNLDHNNWIRHMSPGPIEPGREVWRPRPGHADLAGGMKYDHQDFRNVLERASARETAARVAAGAICRKFLADLHISLYSQVVAIGGETSPTRGQCLNAQMAEKAALSLVGCPDEAASERMVRAIEAAKDAGESLGGAFEVVALGLVPGIGSFTSGEARLDGRIAGAMMSIPAIKGVEIGDGIASAAAPGSQVHDEIHFDNQKGIHRNTNRAGGIEGGVTNGEPVAVRAYMKPIPTLYKPLLSVNTRTWELERADIERSDICAVPAARVVGEAMMAQVLADAILDKFGHDSMKEIRENYDRYVSYLEKVWKWTATSF
ncbi:MAG: chorismate synthase [Solirubrobacterales bacterium]